MCFYSKHFIFIEYSLESINCINAFNPLFDYIPGLFVNLYTSVERLLHYYNSATTPTTPSATTPTTSSSSLSLRYLLFHEFCPALPAILKDGLKAEVITSFGRVRTSAWRVVEALTRQGGPAGVTSATGDLVMTINDRFSGLEGSEEEREERKLAGFIAGMLK